MNTAKPRTMTEVVSVRTTVQKAARPRGRLQRPGRFDSGDFDAGPGRLRVSPHPIAPLTVGFRHAPWGPYDVFCDLHPGVGDRDEMCGVSVE
jgi:hypothetical protein